MFKTGDKVVLLCSTLKKGTGPRMGSEGYVSDETHSLHMPDGKVFASIVTIIFTRYGFESRDKQRTEKKRIINVLPNMMPDNKIIAEKEAARTYTIEFLRAQEKHNKQGNDFAKEIFKAFNHSPIHQAIIVPANLHKTDLINCPSSEFSAWLDSILLNTYLKNTLRDHVMAGVKEKGGGVYKNKLADVLTSAAFDKKEKETSVPKFAESKAKRTEVISFINQLRFMYSNNLIEDVRDVTAGKIGSNDFMNPSTKGLDQFSIIEHLAYHLYSNLIYQEKVNTLMGSSLGEEGTGYRKSLTMVCESVDTIKNTLISLSRFSEG